MGGRPAEGTAARIGAGALAMLVLGLTACSRPSGPGALVGVLRLAG